MINGLLFMGTNFCRYETPCGICTRNNQPCTAHTEIKPRKEKIEIVRDERPYEERRKDYIEAAKALEHGEEE